MSNCVIQSEENRSEVSNLRHEINNALTGIIGHAQMLRMRGNLDQKTLERVEKIEELANRICEITTQLKNED
jgi:nitrogen-specific signal transduction histidine kinase